MRKFYLLLVFALLVWAGSVSGQIDPEKRKLVQLGYNQPVEGASPRAGYAFYYLNQPSYPRTNMTLRLAVAPVFLDSELGIRDALGQYTDIGIGVAGGGYANSYYEFQRGKYVREQSFTGHGGGFAFSIYRRFNPSQEIPLNGVFRISPYYKAFIRDEETDPNFQLPNNHGVINVRSGLRWGGKEPVIQPELAMELSLWYEGQIRSDSGLYGYNGDRELEFASHLFWARGLLNYTFPELKHRFGLSLNMGTSIEPDRFSAYRLGGDLPFTSEFPLLLPGYFFQEISAERFVSLSGDYTLPLDKARRWSLTGFASAAVVNYLPGLEQSGGFNSGAGIGVGYRSRSGRWQVLGSYGYGFEAIRSHGRGAQSFGLLCQIDLGAKRAGVPPMEPGVPERWRSLFPFLQNFF